MSSASVNDNAHDLKSLTEIYHKYKRDYVKHLFFNPGEENLSKCMLRFDRVHLFPASVLEHAPLEAVFIFFDTATYDEIERDVKVVSKALSSALW